VSSLESVLSERLGLSSAAVAACLAAAEAAPPLTPDQSARIRVLLRPGPAVGLTAASRLTVQQAA
jgi:hypothetical protein